MRRLLAIAATAAGMAMIATAPSAALASDGEVGAAAATQAWSSASPATAASGTAPATASPSASATATTTATATPIATPIATPTKTGKPTPTPTPTKTKPSKKPKPPKKPRVKHPPGSTTVTGPHMYIPNTDDSHYKAASTVTVSRTKSLVNQMVQVNWTGFTASSQIAYDNTATDYPVMIAECKGLDPKTPDDCYDATNGGTPAAFGKYGPGNAAYGTTTADGTGKADILLFTNVQNQFLACDQNTPCSLVVVPSQGGDSLDYAKPRCGNHTLDTGGLDLGQYAFTEIKSAPFTANGLCSWARRIVIPLSFAPTPSGCPLRAADFTAGGSPMLATAMQQWQAGFCFGASPVELQYNGSLNESEARSYFQTGVDDVAFTTQPLTGPAKPKYTYAPVAISATDVGYWVDDTSTGQPFTNIKLDARLLTKMLTTSYSYTNDSCPHGGSAGFGCDNAVDNNPQNLYTDPEFQELNRAVWQNAAQPSGYEIPIVLSGNSDMTWEATSWIAADPDANGFLAGQFDPWGMHVNTYYLGLKYPIAGFLPMDPYLPVSSQDAPVYPLTLLANDMALNQQPGTQDVKDETTGNFDSLPPQVTGNRDLWSVIDNADAARFLIPGAALKNATGKFVTPTNASMYAAVKDMTVNPDGITRSMNYTVKDAAAYPLTMVIYAIVPTSGLPAAKAKAIAQFLTDVATTGQTEGASPGELAPGYAPLTQAMRQQTLKAASEVLSQAGNPKPKPKPTASPSKSPSPSSSAAAASPAASVSPVASSIAVSFSHPAATGMSWVVPALLVAGAVLLVTGPAALLLGSPGARAAIGGSGRRLRRAAAWSGVRRLRRVRRTVRKRNP